MKRKLLKLILVSLIFLCNCPGINVNIVMDEYDGIFTVFKIDKFENENRLRSNYTLQCQFISNNNLDTLVDVRCDEITYLANEISLGTKITGKLIHTYDENLRSKTSRTIPDSYEFELDYSCQYSTGNYSGILTMTDTTIFGDSSIIVLFDYTSSDMDILFPDSSFSENDTFNLSKFNNTNLKIGGQYYATWYVLDSGDCANSKFDIHTPK